MKNNKVPNPGSPEAVEVGCICPVLDNHYGKGLGTKKKPTFWYTDGCPVHKKRGFNCL